MRIRGDKAQFGTFIFYGFGHAFRCTCSCTLHSYTGTLVSGLLWIAHI